MKYITYNQKFNDDDLNCQIDIDFDHIGGDWKSPDYLKEHLLKVFEPYKVKDFKPHLDEMKNPLIDVSVISSNDKSMIRILIHEICSVYEDGKRHLNFEFTDWVEARPLSLNFIKLGDKIYLIFDVTNRQSLF